MSSPSAPPPSQPPDERSPRSLLELRAILRHFDAVVVVGLTEGGLLGTQPVVLEEPDAAEECDLWFAAAIAAPPEAPPPQERVRLCAYRPRDHAWITLTARAEVVREGATVMRLWRSDWRVWLAHPTRVDGELAIVRLTVEEAAAWHPDGGRQHLLYRPHLSRGVDEETPLR